MTDLPKVNVFVDYEVYESHSNWVYVLLYRDESGIEHTLEASGTFLEDDLERAEVFARTMEMASAAAAASSHVHFQVADWIRLFKEMGEEQFARATGDKRHRYAVQNGNADNASDHFARCRVLLKRQQNLFKDQRRPDTLTQWFGEPSTDLEPPKRRR